MLLEDIKKLAHMARVDASDEELTSLANDFDPILAYVGQVQEVGQQEIIHPDYIVENVMREDIATHTPGQYTQKMIDQMPDSENGFLKVKQIL